MFKSLLARSSLAVMVTALTAAAQAPLGTAISYQGRLTQGGVPVDALADMQFTLWDVETGGTTPIAGPLALDGANGSPPVDVVEGLFTVELDFGADAFTGEERWLEIQVRVPAGSGLYTTRLPRQPLTATPYALALPALRTVETGGTANVIGGHADNDVPVGLEGVTISGGGGAVGQQHQAAGDFATVAGGRQNIAGAFGVVSGGEANRAHGGSHAVVAGGLGNDALGIGSAVVAGTANDATGHNAFIGGGVENTSEGQRSVASGGFTNYAAGLASTVPGGDRNQAGGDFASAAGRRARARTAAEVGGGDADGDQGTFVWADSADADFTSSGPDEFLVRATGGVGINHNDPVPGALDVAGDGLFSGNVGIGTTTPQDRLHIEGGDLLLSATSNISMLDNAGAAHPVVITDGSDNLQLLAPPGRSISLRTSPSGFQTIRMHVNSAGNVGVGTTTPAATLHVAGTTQTTDFRMTHGAAAGKVLTSADVSGNAQWSDAPAGSQWVDGASGAIFYDEGSVGVGTSAPAETLHVGGTGLRVDGTGGLNTRNPNNTGAAARLDWLNDVPRLRLGGNGAGSANGFDIQKVGDVSLMRILDSGNVGLGLTAPEARLHLFNGSSGTQTAVAGTALAIEDNADAFISFLTPTANAASGLQFSTIASPNSTASFLYNDAVAPRGFHLRVGSSLNPQDFYVLNSGQLGIHGLPEPTDSVVFVQALQHTYDTANDEVSGGAIRVENTSGKDARLIIDNLGISGYHRESTGAEIPGTLRLNEEGGFVTVGQPFDISQTIVTRPTVQIEGNLYLQDSSADVSVPTGEALTFGHTDANINFTTRMTINSAGNVNIPGTLSKGGGSFKIDHPLDPQNKYLYHSFVESPDMMNIYNGVVTTDGNGYATITLPEWFEALNRDFRYQLTVVDENQGAWALARVVRKIAGNQFTIQTSAASLEVSWQVTGIRRDAFAEQNRIPVAEEKSPEDRGRLLHPEAVGRPLSEAIGSADAAAAANP